MKIRKGDTVRIIKGKDRGKSGKIVRALPKKTMVVIEGLNIHKKTIKPKRQGEKGRIVSLAWPIRIENVMLICNACNAPTRTGYRRENGSRHSAELSRSPGSPRSNQRVRYCKKCQAIV